MRKKGKNILNVVLSLTLGGAILYWMYRGFDFNRVCDVLVHEMRWEWMLLSFPFGILAQTIRAWRWRQTLEPVSEQSRVLTRVHSIFLSYAASLVIPRIGEFARCGILKRYDNVSFSKALGTVVTERAIDSLVVLGIAALTFLLQFRVFMTFFSETGTSLDAIFHRFTMAGWLVTLVCALAIGVLGWYLAKGRMKELFCGIWQVIVSLRNVKNVPLFIFYTLAIWLSYFLHYYLTFFCFDATAGLGMMCALVTFIVGSIAVIVPTPNAAGPWHFAVKTMLILYGVTDQDALYFVLIVHSVQTLLVVSLGIYAWIALTFTARRQEKTIN